MLKNKRKIILGLVIMAVVAVCAVFGLSAYVSVSASGSIIATDTGSGIAKTDIDECRGLEPDCILVLGCAVWDNNRPSPMLKDRLDTAIELYKSGAAPKLLLSGDNSRKEYSEPDCMLQYAREQGVPEADIFLDYAGFSTYDSVYRAGDIFKADRIIIVTQKYHLFRALHIGDTLGIEAAGVAADQRKYAGRYKREAREVLARDKDFVKAIIKSRPTFLGDEIPIYGDGRVTHVN